jgi:ADP-glucose pyrophosphorylase
LSLDEYSDHFLLPYSPRFRNIDFAVASLSTIGVKDIIVFAEKDKEFVNGYLVRGWPYLNFHVFDHVDLQHSFMEFFHSFVQEQAVELISMIHGDYPVWFDMNPLLDKLGRENMQAVRTKTLNGDIYPAIVMDKTQFLNRFKGVWMEQGFHLAIDQIVEQQKIPSREVRGIFLPLESIEQYYLKHIDMLDDYLFLDTYNGHVPVKSKMSMNNFAIFKRHSHINNTIIGEGAEVAGNVEGSVIFSDVIVDRGASIINSIILPGNHIAKGAKIINTIIDEFSGDNSMPNIEAGVEIGKAESGTINKKLEQLDFGVTLIGKDVTLPARYKVGANCYVDSFTSLKIIRAKKTLRDGESIIG